MGFEVRPVILIGERGSPLQRFERLSLVQSGQPDDQRLSAL